MKKLSDFLDAHLRIFERPAVPSPDDLRTIHLIGICGTGMGSLAGLLQQAGYHVRGSDAATYPPMSTRLAEMGITVLSGFDPAHLEPAPDLVIVGNACVPTHSEAAFARDRNLVQLSLPEALSHFFLRGRRPLVVAGTHGKTTTTGILTHLLHKNGKAPGFFIGGVMRGTGTSYSIGKGSHFVVEGDEYDSAYFDKRPKFLHYLPASAIVTSMEFDHADIYEDWNDYQEAFRQFASTVDPQGLLVLCADDTATAALAETSAARIRTYGLATTADITATNIVTTSEGQQFTLHAMGESLGRWTLPMSGRHNLLNALGACTVALHEGLPATAIRHALACFPGMSRRQEILGEIDGVLVVDDFAHHPTAVRTTIEATQQQWPDRRLVAVFEPRSNSSRRKAFEKPYTIAFDSADIALLSAPPFRHNDNPERFMDTVSVVRTITEQGTPAFVFSDVDGILSYLLGTVQPGDVVLLMSNGSFGGLQARLLDALQSRKTSR